MTIKKNSRNTQQDQLQHTLEVLEYNALEGRPLNEYISDASLQKVDISFLLSLLAHKYTKPTPTFEKTEYIQTLISQGHSEIKIDPKYL